MEWLTVLVVLVFAALIVTAFSNAKSHCKDKRAHAAGHGYGGDSGSGWFFAGGGHGSCHSHGHYGHDHSPDSHGCDAGGSDGGGCDSGGGGDGGGGGGD